ncbi:MAG: hypothetical protein ABIZ80_10150, partial [Bryobacteraceae bacterium]
AAAFAMQAPVPLSAQDPAQGQAGDDLIVPPPSSPFDVGTRAQLFADQLLVHDTQGIAFRQHVAEKHALNPILKADKEWEGWRLVIYGEVIYDEQDRVFKMWYCSESPGYFGGGPRDSHVVTLYATSTDGVHCDKPLVGTLPAMKSVRHNVVADAELASVTKDLKEPDPARRYKMIAFKDRPRAERGYHTYVSPDGLNWSGFSKQPICPGSDVITGYFDERLGCYVALAKINALVRGHKRRVFHLITSKDS